MTISKQIAKQLHDVYFGGNWSASNLKDTLQDVTYNQATTTIHNLNSIISLVYHINYYVIAVTQVLNKKPLTAKDAYSFNHPAITSQIEWDAFVENTFNEAKEFISHIEQLPDAVLNTIFADEKYGTYYRNLTGIIEHAHYHLGQIVIIKKMIQNKL